MLSINDAHAARIECVPCANNCCLVDVTITPFEVDQREKRMGCRTWPACTLAVHRDFAVIHFAASDLATELLASANEPHRRQSMPRYWRNSARYAFPAIRARAGTRDESVLERIHERLEAAPRPAGRRTILGRQSGGGARRIATLTARTQTISGSLWTRRCSTS